MISHQSAAFTWNSPRPMEKENQYFNTQAAKWVKAINS